MCRSTRRSKSRSARAPEINQTQKGNQALARPLDWQIACKRGLIKTLAEGAQKEALKTLEKARAAVRAFVEHPVHIVKNLFRYRKTRYRGLAKNAHPLHTLFALASVVIAARRSAV